MTQNTTDFGALEAQTTDKDDETTENLEAFGVEDGENPEPRLDSGEDFADRRPDSTAPNTGRQSDLVIEANENQQTLNGESADGRCPFENDENDDVGDGTTERDYVANVSETVEERDNRALSPGQGTALDTVSSKHRLIESRPVKEWKTTEIEAQLYGIAHLMDSLEVRGDRAGRNCKSLASKGKSLTGSFVDELAERGEIETETREYLNNTAKRFFSAIERRACKQEYGGCSYFEAVQQVVEVTDEIEGTDENTEIDRGEGIETDGGTVDEIMNCPVCGGGNVVPAGKYSDNCEDCAIFFDRETGGIVRDYDGNRGVTASEAVTYNDRHGIDRGDGVMTDGGRDVGRPSPVAPELLEEIADVGGRIYVLRALESAASITDMDAVETASHSVDVEEATIREIAEAFVQDWTIWTADTMTVWEAAHWYEHADKTHGTEADMYAVDANEIDRGKGILTDGGRDMYPDDAEGVTERIERLVSHGAPTCDVCKAESAEDRPEAGEFWPSPVTVAVDPSASTLYEYLSVTLCSLHAENIEEHAPEASLRVTATTENDETHRMNSAMRYNVQSVDRLDATAAAGIDRGDGVATDGGRDLPESETVRLITGITGVMHSPRVIEGKTSGTGKTISVDDDRRATVRLDTEEILSGGSEYRDATYYEIYTPKRLQKRQRTNNAPGPQAGANGVSDTDDLPEPTHVPDGEDAYPEPEPEPEPEDDGEDSPEVEDMQTWERAQVFAVEGVGEMLITSLNQTRTSPPTTTSAEAVDRLGNEYLLRTGMMDGTLRVQAGTQQSAVVMPDEDEHYPVGKVRIVGKDMDRLRAYIRGEYGDYFDDDDGNGGGGGGGGDGDRPDNSGDSPRVVTDGGRDTGTQTGLSAFTADDADGSGSEAGRESSVSFEGATSRRPVPECERSDLPGGLDSRALEGTGLAPSDYEIVAGVCSPSTAEEKGYHPDDRERNRGDEPPGMTASASDTIDRGEGVATDGGQTPLESLAVAAGRCGSGLPTAALRAGGRVRTVKVKVLESELPPDLDAAGIVRAARYSVVGESVQGVVGETADGSLFVLCRRDGGLDARPAELSPTSMGSERRQRDGYNGVMTDGGR